MTEHLTEPIPCVECKGTGDRADMPWLVCPFCYGQGVKYVNKPNAPGCYIYPDEPPGRELDEIERGGAT